MTRRILQLAIGLFFYGAGCAFIVEAGIGNDPWTVLSQGISVQTGWGIGWVVNGIGFLVLLAWIPLRQRPGVGTIANILVVGTSMQIVLDVFPPVEGLLVQIAVFTAGLLMIAFASGLYIGAHFGPGPRDGLMTGLNGRIGWPIWLCRLVVEATVLAIGWMLGGTVGFGTLAFALFIGPLVHIALPLLDTRRGAATKTTQHDAVSQEHLVL